MGICCIEVFTFFLEIPNFEQIDEPINLETIESIL